MEGHCLQEEHSSRPACLTIDWFSVVSVLSEWILFCEPSNASWSIADMERWTCGNDNMDASIYGYSLCKLQKVSLTSVPRIRSVLVSSWCFGTTRCATSLVVVEVRQGVQRIITAFNQWILITQSVVLSHLNRIGIKRLFLHTNRMQLCFTYDDLACRHSR